MDSVRHIGSTEVRMRDKHDSTLKRHRKTIPWMKMTSTAGVNLICCYPEFHGIAHPLREHKHILTVEAFEFTIYIANMAVWVVVVCLICSIIVRTCLMREISSLKYCKIRPCCGRFAPLSFLQSFEVASDVGVVVNMRSPSIVTEISEDRPRGVHEVRLSADFWRCRVPFGIFSVVL